MKVLQKFCFFILALFFLTSLSTANSFESKTMEINNQINPFNKIINLKKNIKQVSNKKLRVTFTNLFYLFLKKLFNRKFYGHLMYKRPSSSSTAGASLLLK